MTLKDQMLRPVVKAVELGLKYVAGEWYARNGYPQIARILGAGNMTHTGKGVNEETALMCSTVWACNRVISETVASLPISVYRNIKGDAIEQKDHPLYEVLKYEPNPQMDAMHFRESRTSHCVIRGNGYASVTRRPNGTVIGMWPLDPTAVRAEMKGIDLRYWVRSVNGQESLTDPQGIFHLPGLSFDGVSGVSVIALAKESISLALTQEEYVAKYFARGGRRPYILEHPTKFKTNEDFKAFAERWMKGNANPDTFHNPPILEGGVKYTELGFSLEDVQFLESRQFSVPEICRWFRISPHMVGDLSRATFSNIEHLAIEFVQQTLMAWLVRWEQAIRRQLLTPKEKADGFYVKHNVAALLRGDFASRMAGYASALQNGHLNRNEVRELEDRNSFDGGDDFTIQLNMQTIGPDGLSADKQTSLVKVGTTKPNGGANGNQAD
jgi:HK97 family phage portal protein